jgi:DNA-binding transcriptional regulator YiaG
MAQTTALNRDQVLALARARRYAQTGEAKTIRERHELSLQNIAEGVGVSPVTVWRWEHGESTPQGMAGVRWCTLLEELDSLAGAS